MSQEICIYFMLIVNLVIWAIVFIMCCDFAIVAIAKFFGAKINPGEGFLLCPIVLIIRINNQIRGNHDLGPQYFRITKNKYRNKGW
jgi:hypothetical protein